jgi:hypothetical protein
MLVVSGLPLEPTAPTSLPFLSLATIQYLSVPFFSTAVQGTLPRQPLPLFSSSSDVSSPPLVGT